MSPNARSGAAGTDAGGVEVMGATSTTGAGIGGVGVATTGGVGVATAADELDEATVLVSLGYDINQHWEAAKKRKTNL